MNARMTDFNPQRARGASLITVLVAIAIIIAIAAAAWFLIIQPHRQARVASQPAAVSTSAKPVAKKVAVPVNTAALSTDEILAKASQAIKDQRFLAPEGNNAFELYLEVLQRQPDNQVAKDALRETFPFAANAAEQSINQGSFTEAQREIALLAKAAPNNYTLTILRSKLDARRKVAKQRAEDQQKLAEQQAANAAAAAAAQAKKQQLAAQKKADQLAAQKAAAQKAAQARAARQQQNNQVAQQPPAPSAAPKVSIQGAVLVKQVNPNYPARASRMHRQGWVIVAFTVGTDGKVHDAHVVNSHPGHLFDRAALKAVSQWQFKPALRNGKPMRVTMRKKINFTL